MGNKGSKHHGSSSSASSSSAHVASPMEKCDKNNPSNHDPEKIGRLQREAEELLQKRLGQLGGEAEEQMEEDVVLNVLSRRGFRKLPEGLLNQFGTSLTRLDLSYNRLSYLPKQIASLERLTELDVSSNHLGRWIEGEWAPSLGKLTQLRRLNAAHNGIQYLPADLPLLQHLVYLDVHNNPLREICKELGSATQLTYLDISECEAPALPPELGQLLQLTTLLASHNRFSVIPSTFRDLQSLTKVDLSDNRSKAANVTHLDISCNWLENLPQEISKLSGLTYLNVSQSQMSSFPSDIICSLSALRHLHANALTTDALELPETLTSLASLQTLHLRFNKIHNVPEVLASMTSLTDLDLSGNPIAKLPKYISTLPSLTTLNLSFCQLDEVLTTFCSLVRLLVPEWLLGLATLRQLGLYHNKSVGNSSNEDLAQQPWNSSSIFTPSLITMKDSGHQLGDVYCQTASPLAIDPYPALKLTENASILPKAELRDRIYGCIFGNAIGDAVGLATEFMNKEQANMSYGINTIRYADFARDRHRRRWVIGDFTDDTDQMLLILENMLQHDGIPHVNDFALSLLRWAKQGFGELGDDGGMGIGRTVHSVLAHPTFLEDPHSASEQVWEGMNRTGAANGAVMRTSLLGILNFDNLPLVIQNTQNIAKVTHYDPRCVASCVAVTVAIATMLQARLDPSLPEDREKILQTALECALQENLECLKDGDKQREEFERHLNAKDFYALQLDEGSSIGYTLKCAGAGFVGLRYDNFEEAIMCLVREAGDADTNGAVCGAMLGTKLGFSALPMEWVEGLAHKEWLAAKCEALCEALGLGVGTETRLPDTKEKSKQEK
ncbi:ADP-ribosylglycohydrolase [Balamuthia mandrillaris]